MYLSINGETCQPPHWMVQYCKNVNILQSDLYIQQNQIKILQVGFCVCVCVCVGVN